MSQIEPIAEMINDVAVAELVLLTDFRNDPASEFVQGFLELELMIENIVLSDNPENFFIPDADGNTPYTLLFEKIQGLKELRFGKKTLARMEQVATGNRKEVVKFTEMEKSQDPDYKLCPKCSRYIKKSYIKGHMDSPICVKVSTAHSLRPSSNKKKVADKIYSACLDLESLISRSIDYKKNIIIEPEEEEVEVEDEEIFSIVGTAGRGKTCSRCECKVDRLFILGLEEYCMKCSGRYFKNLDEDDDKIVGSCLGCHLSYTNGNECYCRKCLEEMEEELEEEEEEEMPDLEEVP